MVLLHAINLSHSPHPSEKKKNTTKQNQTKIKTETKQTPSEWFPKKRYWGTVKHRPHWFSSTSRQLEFFKNFSARVVFLCAKQTYGRPTWNCRWFLLAQRTWTLKATHVSSFSAKMYHVICLDPGLDRKILGGSQHHILATTSFPGPLLWLKTRLIIGKSFIWILIFVNYTHFTLWVA